MQFCGEHFGKTCKIGCLPASIQASCNLTRARSSFCLLESCARITLKLWRYRTCFCSTYAKPAKVLFVARLLCSPRLQFDFKHSIQVSAKDCCKSTQLKNSSGTLQYVVKGRSCKSSREVILHSHFGAYYLLKYSAPCAHPYMKELCADTERDIKQDICSPIIYGHTDIV